MKCEICHRTFRRGTGSVIRTKKNGEIAICSSCHYDIIRDGIRYEVDVMIVPVSNTSFKKAVSQRKYVIPSRYKGKRKPKFIAFYRGRGIGAITHIARVVNVISEVPRDEVISLFETEPNNPSIAKRNQRFELFNISEVYQLRHEIVRNDAPPIQNRIFKNFQIFAKARKLEDLYKKPLSEELHA